MLGKDQDDALMKIAESGRLLDVLVGPGWRREDHRHERASPGVGEGTRRELSGRACTASDGRADPRRRPAHRDGEHGEVVAEPPHPRRRLPGMSARHHR